MKELVPYLTFDGNCREAMTFYAAALSGDVHFMTLGETGHATPGMEDKIMHAKLSRPNGTLMASDVIDPSQPPLKQGSNFSISLDCTSAEEEQTFFDNLAAGGSITMPLADTFWGARFGMLEDKFGIAWMFNYDHPKP